MGHWLKILELRIQKCGQLYVTLDRHFWFNSVKNVDNVWDKQTFNLDKRYQVIVTFLEVKVVNIGMYGYAE